MDRPSELHSICKRVPLAILLMMAACSQIGRGSATSALAAARRNVCGEPGGATDAACTTLGYTRVNGGYRVVIARRPPAGSDTVAVTVHGGDFTVEPVHERI
jgi:hypothetical protein